MTSTALAMAERNILPTQGDWGTMLSMAEVLVKSGMLPTHIKTPQAAVAIIQKGRELGIQPMYALSNIAVIQGKPTANAELMLALIYRDHGDNAVRFVESDNKACHISYARRNWTTRADYTFTIDDAKQAGLMSNATWQKYPAAMLRARCISAVARMAFPDSIGGMYTPEEMGAEVDEEGVPIHAPAPVREIRAAATPVEQPARATAMNTSRVEPPAEKQAARGAPFYAHEYAFHDQMVELTAAAQERGVPINAPGGDPRLQWSQIIEIITRCGGPKVPVAKDGRVSPRAVWDALNAIPVRSVDAETGEVLDGPVAVSADAPIRDEEIVVERRPALVDGGR